MKNEKELKQEDIDVTLPSEILNQQDEDDDSDMPLPETTEYNKENPANNRILVPTMKFYNLFKECMGKLPYAAILKNSNNDQIKLVDLFRFIDAKMQTGMAVNEMNTIISFIVSAPYEFIHPLMEIVDAKDRQQELWTLQ